jgi:hypothetical protein
MAGLFDDVAAECRALLHEVRSGGVRTVLGQAEAAKALRERAGDLLNRMQRMSATMRETLLEHSGAAGILADAGPVTSAIRHELLVEQLAAFARFGFRLLQEEAEQQVKEASRAPTRRRRRRTRRRLRPPPRPPPRRPPAPPAGPSPRGCPR